MHWNKIHLILEEVALFKNHAMSLSINHKHFMFICLLCLHLASTASCSQEGQETVIKSDKDRQVNTNKHNYGQRENPPTLVSVW